MAIATDATGYNIDSQCYMAIMGGQMSRSDPVHELIRLQNGTIWMYPGVGDIYFLPPTPSTDSPSASAPSPASSSSSSCSSSTPHIPHPSLITRYTFTPGPNANQHVFCTTCGVQVIEISGSADVLAAGCADDKGYRDSADNIHCQLGVNIACLNRAGEWLSDGKGEGLGLEVDREFDEREPLYRLRL